MLHTRTGTWEKGTLGFHLAVVGIRTLRGRFFLTIGMFLSRE